MKLADISRGVVLGERFRLVDFLGDGSNGYVWKADVIDHEAHDLPQVVAIKIFKNYHSGDKFLFREADTARNFDHERLAKVFDAKRIDGLPIMWMEFVPGESLHAILGDVKTPLPVSLETVLEWLKGIAEALAQMHLQEIGHGDLKLDNVIVDPDRGIRLIDFGQSRPLPERFVDTNGHGAFPFLAPEVMSKEDGGRGKRCVQSDIYAAGVIAYRILTGRFPRSTLSEFFNQVPFPPARELNSSVPTALDAIVNKCLKKKPEDRYQTGCELFAALESLSEKAAENKEVLQVPRPEHVEGPSVADQVLAFAEDLIRDGKFDDAMVRLEKAMQRMSTSPRILLIYGEASKRVGNYDTSLRAYSRALAWMEQHGWPDEQKCDAIEGIGEVSIRLKRYEQAVTHFERLTELLPGQTWYRYRYGVSLALEASNPMLRKSIEVLQSLYDEHPSALIAAKIGKAYEELRQIDLAGQYYNEALMLDQHEPTALFQLGRLRAIQGRMDKAEECLDRLRQIEGAEDEADTLVRLMTGD
ncbi:protein kinase domain-containing protein [Roseiconus lacunae]|uniref:Serine/threonine-protein kinase n=1 Tax=Roseiconus lacunae TaxID=2605694 RepID=A0ABT7PNU8_9BACT|nr:serine/threonine-protein kinase [Roseiconus lacunae]MDM4018174.1 serine/threonine-protein kinase [Roseiconus lacunae]